MTTEKMYRYLGRNGTITTSVKLENINPIPMVRLKASEDKILTNGVTQVHTIVVFEDEVSDWKEIDYIGQE